MLIFVTEKNNADTPLLSLNEITKKDFLESTKAVIYLSTTADQDIDNKGLSYSVFVKEDHSVQAFAMKGLELGSIAAGNNQILLEDKNSIYLLGDHTKKFEMENPQYTGERTGYLPNSNVFFSIYNTGFVENGYSSEIRYGNSAVFQADTIPYYIAASGTTDNSIEILTQDFEKDQFYLKEVTFNNKLNVKDITAIQTESTENMQVLAPILSDENYYYMVLSTIISDTSETVSLQRIHRESLMQDTFEFINYKDADLTATIPYNYKNSAAIHNDKLFYINGLGEVYSFHLPTTTVKKEFSLKDADHSAVRHNEETYFKSGNLYVLRHSADKKAPYYLESYSLDNGKLTDSMTIKGLDTLITSSNNKKVYSYDLKVLK